MSLTLALAALAHRRREHHVTHVLRALPVHGIELPNASFYNQALADHFDRDIAARVDGVDNSVSDDEILAILGKMIKQRKDSATAYGNAGRTELAAQELSEIEIITGFLPKQLNDDEIEDVVKKVINDSGASGIRDMGKVMGLLKKNYTGQMDFGKAGGLVKSLLG